MKKFLKFWSKYGMFALLFVLIALFGILRPQAFLSKATFLNILRQASIIGTIACGVMMLIVTGATDTSAGGRCSFIVCVAGYMAVDGVNVWLIALFCIVTGAVTGAFNAILAETLHTGTFVVSIATNNMWMGLSYILTKGVMIRGFGDDIKAIAQTKVIGDIPSIAVVWLVCILISTFIMSYTRFGRHVYALGGNRGAAFLAGINVVKTNILTHTIAGGFLGVGALLYLSRAMTANAGIGGTYSFDCITACVLGGVMLGGGRGKVYQAVLGILVTYTLFNGLVICGISDFVRQVLTGVLLLFAIWMEVQIRNAKIDLTDDTAGGADAKKKEDKAVEAAK